MIAPETRDHDGVRRLAAASIDGFLTTDEAATLREHLRECTPCRATDAALRRDAQVLRQLDLGAAPTAARTRVAVHAGRALAPRHGMGRGTAVFAAAVLLLTAVAASTVGGGAGRPEEPTPPASLPVVARSPIVLQTAAVTLAADDLWVEVGGKRFHGRGEVQVEGDPGDATYRTLELRWREHGVPMRVNVYFGGDAASWWVDAVRVYDGTADPSWLVARGRRFQTPLGMAWTGDVNIRLVPETGGGGPATLHISKAILSVQPFDAITEPAGGGVVLQEGQELFGPGADLHCSGIPQMHPKDAERVLLAMGFKLSWRLITDVDGNESYWHVLPEAPDGRLVVDAYGTMVGTDGELILPVLAPGEPGPPPAPLPRPEDCPPEGSPEG